MARWQDWQGKKEKYFYFSYIYFKLLGKMPAVVIMS
jgi:hypothetical protein